MSFDLYGAAMSSYSDETIAKLRVVVDVIGRETVQSPSTPAFHAAWTELVALLALGPPPETRECPVCHQIGMRAASRCGRCWTALELLPPLSNGAAQRVES
jgi:uncharacterized paraquat-inducible protein A